MFGNNPYARNFNNNLSQQNLYDQIDYEINNLQQMKEKMKSNNAQMQNQQPSINQTFQLAPTNREVIRYANSIEDVQRDVVVGDTPYFSKDMSIVWVKSINGSIKSYELNEIVEKDAKDMQIEFLQSQIEELRKEMKKNEQPTTNATIEQNATNTSKLDEPIGGAIEKKEPSSLQRISTSKKR